MSLRTVFSLRKMKNNIAQMIGMGILIAIAALFFTTLFTFKTIYEKEMTTLFHQKKYADVTLTGSFTDIVPNQLKKQLQLSAVEARSIQDFRSGEKNIRLISISEKLNQVTLEADRLPETSSECVIISQYARKNKVNLNDTLTVNQKKIENSRYCPFSRVCLLLAKRALFFCRSKEICRRLCLKRFLSLHQPTLAS